ncbi:Outer envelope protein 64, mitochondrial [Capsicum annuum]|nr:Outer envelope protein 64, mitochondrial [Capsicum annuum]
MQMVWKLTVDWLIDSYTAVFCPSSSKAPIAMCKLLLIVDDSYEFKTNYEEWMKAVKPRLGSQVSNYIAAAVTLAPENIKVLYRVRTEMRVAMKNLLKNDGILVLPSTADPPLKLKSRQGLSAEVHDRTFALLGIASMSGCCQAAIPLGEHDNYPISLSFIASHGTDKFLLDTFLDMYSSLQEEVSIQSSASPLQDTNGSIDESELLKEKGNAAFKGRQWYKAVSYYTEAIKLNDNATYYCNRAAAYLELGCFQQAEEDCTTAISLDKKNVKAYMRRGTARESLFFYKEALQGSSIACFSNVDDLNLLEMRLDLQECQRTLRLVELIFGQNSVYANGLDVRPKKVDMIDVEPFGALLPYCLIRN